MPANNWMQSDMNQKNNQNTLIITSLLLLRKLSCNNKEVNYTSLTVIKQRLEIGLEHICQRTKNLKKKMIKMKFHRISMKKKILTIMKLKLIKKIKNQKEKKSQLRQMKEISKVCEQQVKELVILLDDQNQLNQRSQLKKLRLRSELKTKCTSDNHSLIIQLDGQLTRHLRHTLVNQHSILMAELILIHLLAELTTVKACSHITSILNVVRTHLYINKYMNVL